MNSKLPFSSEGLVFMICTMEGQLFQAGQAWEGPETSHEKIILNQPNTAKQETQILTSVLARLLC